MNIRLQLFFFFSFFLKKSSFRLCWKELMKWVSSSWTWLEIELVYLFSNLREKVGNSCVPFLHSAPGETEWEAGRDFLTIVCCEWLAKATTSALVLSTPAICFPGSFVNELTQVGAVSGNAGERETGAERRQDSDFSCGGDGKKFVGVWSLHNFLSPLEEREYTIAYRIAYRIYI